MSYAEFYKLSVDDPQAFWAKQAELIDWHQPYTQALDYANPPFARWFVGGQTNLCFNAVDRWLNTQSDQPPLIAISTEFMHKHDLSSLKTLHLAGEPLKEIMAVVDQRLGSLARPSRVHFVTLLPKTRSGKLLRRPLQAICAGRDPGDLSTIEGPASLEQIRAAIPQ